LVAAPVVLTEFPGVFAMHFPSAHQPLAASEIVALADAAARAIPPAWPLSSSVAVNPYLGQAGLDLAHAGALLERVGCGAITMPRSWYYERIESGSVNDDDLLAALTASTLSGRPGSIDDLKRAAQRPQFRREPLPTIADLAAQVSGIDWPAIIAERFGAWVGAWSDQGQALWAAPLGRNAYRAWQSVAVRDLTPEIAGLKGFTAFVADAPDSASESMAESAARLMLTPQSALTYFHALLITQGGWAQLGRYRLWQAELGGETDTTVTDFLCIRLMWEDALFARFRDQIEAAWHEVIAAHAQPLEPDNDQCCDTILQEAVERSAQRKLGRTLNQASTRRDVAAPVLQAAFCIDVRSEVFRRALETLDPQIRTLGFAGFFGIATSHRQFASDVPEHRLPVLLNAGLSSSAGGPADATHELAMRAVLRAKRAWGRFKLAAVSSFAFVEAAGPVYFAKLVRDSLGRGLMPLPHDPTPKIDSFMGLDERIAAAATVLRAMSLTSDFAPLVLLVGHGANVVNNPHASALHCGACGGYSGEVNARLLAALLNDQEVRSGLERIEGITVPGGTLFLGALHDTTCDDVLVYESDHPSPGHAAELARARDWLARAGALARGERALRLPRATGAADLARRSRDWAEIRPEWALAGCSAFIAAPRERTSGARLDGRAFLHDYDWQNDDGFGVLELIMTAPVVVASWISLQYFGSAIAPDVFGGGNKLIHNVIGGIGVVEGNGGTLRTGLPWQSVDDGNTLMHEPLRLTVCIEAPVAAITDILSHHAAVRALFDNRWLHLLALDDTGTIAWRYRGNLRWEQVDPEGRTAIARELAV